MTPPSQDDTPAENTWVGRGKLTIEERSRYFVAAEIKDETPPSVGKRQAQQGMAAPRTRWKTYSSGEQLINERRWERITRAPCLPWGIHFWAVR